MKTPEQLKGTIRNTAKKYQEELGTEGKSAEEVIGIVNQKIEDYNLKQIIHLAEL